MTIGDILAVIAAVIVVLWTLSSVSVVTTLIAVGRVSSAQKLLVEKPLFLIGRGAALVVLAIISIITFHQATFPPEKIISGLLLVALSVVGVCGSAVLISFIRERLKGTGAGSSTLHGLYCSALLCLGASLTPIIGWFLIAPSLLAVCLGAGTIVLKPTQTDVEISVPARTTSEALLS